MRDKRGEEAWRKALEKGGEIEEIRGGGRQIHVSQIFIHNQLWIASEKDATKT
jgi:hypothetical protein